MLVCSSLIPRHSTLPVLITCSMQKWREMARRISSHYLQHNCHMSSHFLSTVKWCTRLILHSMLATKVGQAPAESYTKHMKHTKAKSHDSKRLLRDKYQNTQQWCNHLVEQKDGNIWSCTTYITAIPQALNRWICFTGGTYVPLLWNLYWFSSFSVTVDTNVK